MTTGPTIELGNSKMETAQKGRISNKILIMFCPCSLCHFRFTLQVYMPTQFHRMRSDYLHRIKDMFVDNN